MMLLLPSLPIGKVLSFLLGAAGAQSSDVLTVFRLSVCFLLFVLPLFLATHMRNSLIQAKSTTIVDLSEHELNSDWLHSSNNTPRSIGDFVAR